MEHSTSSRPPHEEKTQNPAAAIGRKIKSVLGTDQRPSVRIMRTHDSQSRSRASQSYAEKPLPALPPQAEGEDVELKGGVWAKASRSAGSWFGSGRDRQSRMGSGLDGAVENEYDPDTVDLLDVVDPEVATLSTLTNVQNSLFVPQLGKIVNRRATYRLSDTAEGARTIDKLKTKLKNLKNKIRDHDEEESILGNCQYAVLPDGERLEGWTKEDKEELDDLVRHQLHSRRAKFKRAMKGFSQYVRRPLGLFVTVYATLVTLFGAAWVFFLIGWISLGSKQDYVVNIVDNVLVALFAIIGDGLAPFRAVDTYHMIYIAHYHRKTWKRREKLGLPELADRNDLPEARKQEAPPPKVDLESRVARRTGRGLARFITPRIPKKYAEKWAASESNDPKHDYTVLTEEQQQKLEYHERKFSKSHTFYKPHETETHYAFPLKLLIVVVVLLDLHSCLQISLGACTWGINYKTRPFALTTVILCFSITCNIMGGVVISMGDKRTRKKDVIERMMRQELTSEAIESMVQKRLKEAEERGEIDPAVRKRIEEERDAEENEEIKKSWKSVPALPKTLLGKGVDHRQPSLPQQMRGSSGNVAENGSSTPKGKEIKRKELPRVAEGVQQLSGPEAIKKDEDPLKEGFGKKTLRMIRKTDLDRS